MSGNFICSLFIKMPTKKTFIGFFGLNSYCWYLFSLPIKEKLLLNFIPKAQKLVSASFLFLFFFIFSKDKFHFPVLAFQKDVYWGYQVLPVQLSVPRKGTHGTRSHVIYVSVRRKMEKFDLTQGQVRSLADCEALLLWVLLCCAEYDLGRFSGHGMTCRYKLL